MKITVGENIRFIRHMKGLSQDDVAKKLNISIPAISKIETGVTDVNLSRLEQIASLFEMSVVQLVGFNKKIENNKVTELDLLNDKLFNREIEMVELQQKVITLFEELRMNKKTA